MSNKVLLKKSSVNSKVPLTSDLDYGELALNYADGKLYFKDSSNNIKSFMEDSSIVTLTGTQTLTNKTLSSAVLTGTLTAGGSVGSSGQVLSSTGTGVQWITPSGGGGAVTLAIAGDSGTDDVSVGTDTLTFVGGTGLTSTVTNNTVTFDIDSTVATLTGTQTLTNKTISGASNTITNIGNSSLTNSSITVNGTAISLGGSATITAANPNTLTIGTGLSGTSYNGSSAVTIAIDSTVVTLSGTQTLTNKTLTTPTVTDMNLSTGSSNLAKLDVVQATVATVSATAIDSWAIASYRSAKYIVQITQGTNYQISEILVAHDGTTTFNTVYAQLETNGQLATFTTDISAGNARLLVTMGSATSATINIQATMMAV